ncbi:MAG: diphosphomevalonate decarboxylase [Gammaproteobacteria bacterium]|nr:diphosphomevalonate decarboxylase [Gammaproteobacteria bacterium]
MTIQRAAAVAHPNVALIKYWGKRSDGSVNLPAVDSLSVTLAALRTETRVAFDPALAEDELLLNGVAASGEQVRLTACLDALRAVAGTSLRARVESRNDFPTGAGLASSASGYAALTVAAAAALGLDRDDPRLGEVARIGSGSAPRSLYGGFVELRNRADQTICRQLLSPTDWPMDIVVAVTTEAGKEISSRDGMTQSRDSSPFYAAWLDSHPGDMDAALSVLGERDFGGLADLAEHNCLKMHAVMLTTRPPLMYWSPTTLACLHHIRQLRKDGVPVFFTVDAGPQVKAICLPAAADRVERELAGLDGVLRTIRGGLGAGVRLIPVDD